MDSIANALTIIRNGQAVKRKKVQIPFSNLVWNILKVFEKEDFIKGLKKKGRKLNKKIEVKIKYQDDKPFIRGLEKVSKQGQRIYISSQDISPIRNGFGRIVISTSKGVITGREAKSQNLGGEILCKIW